MSDIVFRSRVGGIDLLRLTHDGLFRTGTRDEHGNVEVELSRSMEQRIGVQGVVKVVHPLLDTGAEGAEPWHGAAIYLNNIMHTIGPGDVWCVEFLQLDIYHEAKPAPGEAEQGGGPADTSHPHGAVEQF